MSEKTEILYRHFLSSGGIITDSRKAGSNMIFFALRGENFNGNEFASKALDAGCNLAVVDDPQVASGDKYYLVDDALVALQELARFHRQKIDIPVIGITGSNGKTTTKELINAVLSIRYRTIATSGNLNNHIGVPLSILKIRKEEIAIIEMGANHQGEIDFLCSISRPDYGIITNIGKAHLEGFGSFEGVKKAKSELYRYLAEKGGTIFINGSDNTLLELAQLENLQKVYYRKGAASLCDGSVIESGENLNLNILFPKEHIKLRAKINLTGAYNLENILAAASVGYYFGIPPGEIIRGLETYRSTINRSQYIETGKNLVISDAYNANPSSMNQSLENFIKLKKKNKVIILGDMLELGKYSGEEHQSILDKLKLSGIPNVILVGTEFNRFREKYDFHFFSTVSQLTEHLSQKPIRNSLVLLKGSRGIALENLISVL